LLTKFDRLRGSPRKDLYDLMLHFRTIWNVRDINALPTTYEDAQLAIREDIGATHQPAATRSLEWLQEYGKCIDHIIPGKSTIEGAGHGAFAKRDLSKETVITGSPLRHIPQREEFVNTYEFTNDNGRQVVRQQIIINYCYGSSETSVLLCPYGKGIGYINHNQTLANVKIQWSQDGASGHKESWLGKSPKEMEQYSSGLGFDYIATSDIQEGEELFLDYGNDWEQAWQDHISDWRPIQSWFDIYTNSYAWNEMMADTPLRTEEEALYGKQNEQDQAITYHTSVSTSNRNLFRFLSNHTSNKVPLRYRLGVAGRWATLLGMD
jgi:hypothetical protein